MAFPLGDEIELEKDLLGRNPFSLLSRTVEQLGPTLPRAIRAVGG